MNRKRMVLALAAVLVLASLGWLMLPSKTSQAAPSPSGDTALKGKVLLVNTSNMSAFLLEKTQVQKIGEHSWLMGKGAADGRMGGWYKGRTVRLRMEHIVSITEFDELKDGKKALESGGGTPFGPYGVPVEATTPSAVPPAPAAPPPPPK
jgi:hypothetical protein